MAELRTSGQPHMTADRPAAEGEMLDSLFNIDNGYLEGLVRGFKNGILKQTDYLNLVQCESLDVVSVLLRLALVSDGLWCLGIVLVLEEVTVLQYLEEVTVVWYLDEITVLWCLEEITVLRYFEEVTVEKSPEEIITTHVTKLFDGHLQGKIIGMSG
ncbi:V-type proton ATPase subunit d 1 [Portunus trituberculatus]|uniref:V-type proton ATPase subunit d 1 n=1 Tax=Portunus trituberculatus TaxID=210409 RepID=A0A5B7CH55_PORTR|nr:V-type proton ATPase subunit d 1 [Portunus trituberculatus]